MAEPAGQPARHEPECTYCHVEIPSKDFDQAKQFYGDVFGWIFQDVPMGDSRYVFYQTREGNVGGGLMSPPPGAPSQVVNYILVNDVEVVGRRAVRTRVLPRPNSSRTVGTCSAARLGSQRCGPDQ